MKLPLLSAYGTSCTLLTLLDLLLEKASCVANSTLKNMALVRCFVLTFSHPHWVKEIKINWVLIYIVIVWNGCVILFFFKKTQLLLVEQGTAKWGGIELYAQLVFSSCSLDLLHLPPKWVRPPARGLAKSEFWFPERTCQEKTLYWHLPSRFRVLFKATQHPFFLWWNIITISLPESVSFAVWPRHKWGCSTCPCGCP